MLTWELSHPCQTHSYIIRSSYGNFAWEDWVFLRILGNLLGTNTASFSSSHKKIDSDLDHCTLLLWTNYLLNWFMKGNRPNVLSIFHCWRPFSINYCKHFQCTLSTKAVLFPFQMPINNALYHTGTFWQDVIADFTTNSMEKCPIHSLLGSKHVSPFLQSLSKLVMM